MTKLGRSLRLADFDLVAEASAFGPRGAETERRRTGKGRVGLDGSAFEPGVTPFELAAWLVG